MNRVTSETRGRMLFGCYRCYLVRKRDNRYLQVVKRIDLCLVVGIVRTGVKLL